MLMPTALEERAGTLIHPCGSAFAWFVVV